MSGDFCQELLPESREPAIWLHAEIFFNYYFSCHSQEEWKATCSLILVKSLFNYIFIFWECVPDL